MNPQDKHGISPALPRYQPEAQQMAGFILYALCGPRRYLCSAASLVNSQRKGGCHMCQANTPRESWKVSGYFEVCVQAVPAAPFDSGPPVLA